MQSGAVLSLGYHGPVPYEPHAVPGSLQIFVGLILNWICVLVKKKQQQQQQQQRGRSDFCGLILQMQGLGERNGRDTKTPGDSKLRKEN